MILALFLAASRDPDPVKTIYAGGVVSVWSGVMVATYVWRSMPADVRDPTPVEDSGN